MICLKIGRVYRIICLPNPEIQYVGSTFNQLRARWSGHKSDYKKRTNHTSIYKYFDKYGIENFRMILIKEYLVCVDSQRDARHLRVYEQLWINKLKCVNKMNAITFDFIKKEKAKEYIKQNSEKIKEYGKEYGKEYRKENSEKIKEYGKEYRKENSEKIKEQKKEYIKQNAEKISEKGKKYYNKNSEKIKEYGKEYRKENSEIFSEKVICNFCKSEVRKYGLNRHQKTKKCIKFQ